MSEETSARDNAAKVEKLDLRGMIALRGDFADEAFRKAIRDAAGLEIPAVRRIDTAGDRALAWMSPDELLLLSPYAEAGELRDAIAGPLEGVHHLAVDVSDARATFRISGESAREVLAKGVPVDLSREAFGVGDFRRTRLGQVAVAFWLTDAQVDAFELVCFRSVAQYIHDWLELAAREGSMPRFL